jgi:maleate isomerase
MNDLARRIGVLIPPANFVCETEYPHAVPPQFSFHFNRLTRTEREISAASLVAMKHSAISAAKALSYAGMEVIAYACTSGSFLSGASSHEQIADDIGAALKLPAITTSTAILKALRHLKARRVFILTPYPLPVTRETVRFISESGFDVVSSYTFDCPDSSSIAAVPEAAVAALLREKALEFRSKIDAMLVTCTNLRTLGGLEALEAECDVPIVSSNSATLWAAIRILDPALSLPTLGRLGLVPTPGLRR